MALIIRFNKYELIHMDLVKILMILIESLIECGHKDHYY